MSDTKILRKNEHMCPRRDEVGGAGVFNFPGPDRWDAGRWSWMSVLIDFLRDKFDPHFFGGTSWPATNPKPRACSYCGSVHPDDAISLLKRGWTVEKATGKNYKFYFNPPAGQKSPVPPVKLYIMHCSREQVDALNAANKR